MNMSAMDRLMKELVEGDWDDDLDEELVEQAMGEVGEIIDSCRQSEKGEK